MSYTVVIPAYLAAPYIGETLASVMAQTLPPERIIVVDDGSPDDTAGVVRAFGGPVTYVRQENTGPGGATTRGVSMVETEFVATIDHDDLWMAHKSQLQLDRLAAEPAVAAVFARVAEFSGDPIDANIEGAYDGWTRPTMMMRTSVARSIGVMVDTSSKLGEMVDWLARAREAGHRLVMMPEVLALRRLHAGSLSSRDRGELSRSYLEIAREAMLRRRKSTAADP